MPSQACPTTAKRMPHNSRHRQHHHFLLLAVTVRSQFAFITYLLWPSAGPCCCCCCAPTRPVLRSTAPSCRSSNAGTTRVSYRSAHTHSPQATVRVHGGCNGRQLLLPRYETRRDAHDLTNSLPRLGMRTRIGIDRERGEGGEEEAGSSSSS